MCHIPRYHSRHLFLPYFISNQSVLSIQPVNSSRLFLCSFFLVQDIITSYLYHKKPSPALVPLYSPFCSQTEPHYSPSVVSCCIKDRQSNPNMACRIINDLAPDSCPSGSRYQFHEHTKLLPTSGSWHVLFSLPGTISPSPFTYSISIHSSTISFDHSLNSPNGQVTLL